METANERRTDREAQRLTTNERSDLRISGGTTRLMFIVSMNPWGE